MSNHRGSYSQRNGWPLSRFTMNISDWLVSIDGLRISASTVILWLGDVGHPLYFLPGLGAAGHRGGSLQVVVL